MIKNMFTKKGDEVLTERDKKIDEFGKMAVNWNLEDILTYLRGQFEKAPVADEGLAYIIKRFNEKRSHDIKAPNDERREFEPYDRPERTQKGLTLVLSIMARKELSPDSFPLIEEFLKIYDDVIKALDKALQQTFEHKLKETYKNANIAALAKSQMKRELSIRYE